MAHSKWTDEYLAKRSEYWSKRLRNGDWKCRARLVSRQQMREEWGNDAITTGWCSRERDHKSAVISMLDPKAEAATYRDCGEHPERVLVHEQLHISVDVADEFVERVLGYLSSEARSMMRDRWTTIKEQLINQLADALINRQDVFNE
jgi:hypothetical protein